MRWRITITLPIIAKGLLACSDQADVSQSICKLTGDEKVRSRWQGGGAAGPVAQYASEPARASALRRHLARAHGAVTQKKLYGGGDHI